MPVKQELKVIMLAALVICHSCVGRSTVQIGLICFQARCCTNIAFIFLMFVLCYNIFFIGACWLLWC